MSSNVLALRCGVAVTADVALMFCRYAIQSVNQDTGNLVISSHCFIVGAENGPTSCCHATEEVLTGPIIC